MFYRVWKLRAERQSDLLVFLRFFDVLMGLLVLYLTMVGQSFIDSSKAFSLFCGSLILLLVKNHFEKATKYNKVYFAFTIQFLVMVAISGLPNLKEALHSFQDTIASHSVSLPFKFVLFYITTISILVFLFALVWLRAYFVQQKELFVRACSIYRLLKTSKFLFVENVKKELCHQADAEDILTAPFVFLILAVNEGVIDDQSPVMKDLIKLVRELSIYTNPNSLRKAKVHNLLELISYLNKNKPV